VPAPTALGRVVVSPGPVPERTEPIEGALVEDERAEELALARPYRAVVSEVPGVEVFRVEDTEMARPRARRAIDGYVTDIPIAIAAALLAASTFLPWYKGPAGFGIEATGWASGTWGPVIAFLALGSFVLVVLRRAGVTVSLPVEESLFHEGAGWISLVGAVIKTKFRPGSQGLLTASYGLWIAIGLSVVLIILAGRMSPHAPLVVRPGWHKARAGAVGVVVLAVVVAGSAVFGATNKASLTPHTSTDQFSGTVRGKLPDCAKDFPLPPGVKPDYGFGSGSSCQVQLLSTKSSADLTAAFRAILRQNHYVFTEVTGAPGSTVFTITKPRCATLAVVPAETGSLAAVAFSICTPQST